MLLLLLLLLLCTSATAFQMPPPLALQTRINQHIHVQSVAQSEIAHSDALKARRKRKPKAKSAIADSVHSNAVAPAPKPQAQPKHRPQQQTYSSRGNNPNIHWRAVSMDELRQHPEYVCLPSASELRRVATQDDFSKLRQDCSAWDAVHEGRLTTSSCASVSAVPSFLSFIYLYAKAGRHVQLGLLCLFLLLTAQALGCYEEQAAKVLGEFCSQLRYRYYCIETLLIEHSRRP
jgi:hypothetical protein